MKAEKQQKKNKIQGSTFSFILTDSKSDYGNLIVAAEKIKEEHHDSFEFICIGNDAAAESFFSVLPANMVKKAADISGALEAAEKDYCVFVDKELKQHISLTHFFSIKDTVSNLRKLWTIHFPGESTGTILLVPTTLAVELCVGVGEKAIMEILFRAEQENIGVSSIAWSFDNPFMETHKISLIKQLLSFFSYWYKWYIVMPLHQKSNASLLSDQLPIWRLIFVALSSILLVLMISLSRNAGISGDEVVQHEHAEKVFLYYTTFGKDTAALYDAKTLMHQYGASFDVVAAFINHLFGVEDVYTMRHMLNAFCGWIAILFTALTVVLLAGWRTGVIALVLMFLSPVFLGHSWNNPKDVPFAMAYIFSIYYTLQFMKRLPQFSLYHAVMTAIGIGMAISVRVGGLLIVAYVFMIGGLYYLNLHGIKGIFSFSGRQFMIKLLLWLVAVSVAGYFLGLLLWPYALQNPLKHPIEALTLMTNYSTSLRQLFEGKLIWSDKIPWYYGIKYIAISTPALVFIGICLLFILIFTLRRYYHWLCIFYLLFTCIFPVVYIIYKKSNVYGGWRHILFSYPSFIALSAIGYESLLRLSESKYVRLAIVLVMAVLCYHPVRHMIVNHPLEYIYYNEFQGGVDNALGKYEMDYYYHSIRPGAEWLITNVVENDSIPKPIIITSNHTPILNYYFRHLQDKVKIVYTRYYDRGEKDWDYGVYANSYIEPFQLKKGFWPPSNTIHTIRVDNVPVCAVVKRKTKNDYLGVQAMQQNNYMMAITHLEQAIKEESDNEVAFVYLARLYNDIGNIDRAIQLCQQCLKFNPNHEQAMETLGLAYLRKGKVDEAIMTFMRIIDVNFKYVTSYYYLGYIYLHTNKPYDAVMYLQKCIEINGRYKPAYYLMADALRSLGKTQEAEQYINAAKSF